MSGDRTERTGGVPDDAEDALEALFAEARAQSPGPDLMARVLADARGVQAARAAPAAFAARPRPRRMPAFVEALGGWGGLGGVTAAGIFGLAVGFWTPDTIEDWAGGSAWFLSGSAISPDLGDLALEAGDV